MSFINELRIIDEVPSRNRRSIFDNNLTGGIRHCEWLPINEEYCLSVQASEYHRCIPRGLVPLDEYTHFEMALIYEGSLTTNMSVISEFNKYEELMDYFDGGVFNEVPKELINDLYRWVKNK